MWKKSSDLKSNATFQWFKEYYNIPAVYFDEKEQKGTTLILQYVILILIWIKWFKAL